MMSLFVFLYYLSVFIILAAAIVTAINVISLKSRISAIERSTEGIKDAVRRLAEIQAASEAAPEAKREKTEPQAAPQEPVLRPIERLTPEAVDRRPAEGEQAVPPTSPAVPARPVPPPIPQTAQKPSAPKPARAKTPVIKPAAAAESWFSVQLKNAKAWLFSEGNVWVTTGVLLFLAGFGLLFSYAAQMKWISLEMRLALSALAGFAMTAFGWRMRERRRVYALVLQGGGVGVMYIVLFAGAKLGPIAPSAAIVGMVALSAATVFLSIRQDFQPLAVFALLGGYMAPIIVSTGSDNFVALFSIYSLLNFEILVLSLRKNWKLARWGGMLASAVVGAVWGILRWKESYLASVEPFIALYFVSYSAVTLIPVIGKKFARLAGGGAENIDRAMALTLPFIFLVLQVAATSHTEYITAVSCALLGAWYLWLSSFILGGRYDEYGLSGAFLSYGILFLSLAAPFLLGKSSSSSIWALEGACLAAYGSVRKNRTFSTFGVIMQAAAFLLYIFAPFLHLPERLYSRAFMMTGFLDWCSLRSPFAVTALIFASSALSSSFFTRVRDSGGGDAARQTERPAATCSWQTLGFSVYGTMWWTLAALHISRFVFVVPGGISFALLCGAAAAAFWTPRFRMFRDWEAVRVMTFVPVLAMMINSVASSKGFHPASALGTVLVSVGTPLFRNWFSAAVMFFSAVLWTYRGGRPGRAAEASWGILLFGFVQYTCWMWGKWTVSAFGDKQSDLHYLVSFMPVFAAVLALMPDRISSRLRLNGYGIGSFAACAALWLWRTYSFVSSLAMRGHGFASVYIPLLNPMEMGQALYLAALGLLYLRARAIPALYKSRFAVLSAAVFVWLNSIAARSSWHYFREHVSWDLLFSKASHFQAIIAMLWGIAALALIYCGKKFADRRLWFTGAGLLALDIAKLLLIDLRTAATIIRIVAFLALGGFFLLIGWNAPLPPKRHKPDEAQ
ncbi:MAG: DUF2339 domain-containing protein [Synergistaceae bacterium]|nr:DUF2339 domain-containing protein [Synergistaceae bacterium]